MAYNTDSANKFKDEVLDTLQRKALEAIQSKQDELSNNSSSEEDEE